jgi:hypothetical protein
VTTDGSSAPKRTIASADHTTRLSSAPPAMTSSPETRALLTSEALASRFANKQNARFSMTCAQRRFKFFRPTIDIQ